MTLFSGFQNTTLRDFGDLNLLLYILISCGHSFFYKPNTETSPLGWLFFLGDGVTNYDAGTNIATPCSNHF